MNRTRIDRKLCFGLCASLILIFTASAQTLAQTQADKEYEVGAVLWQQSSGEARALAYQSYALARMILDRDLRMNRRSRTKRAIIVDIDETILDNSAHETWLIRNHQSYNPKDWTEWCRQAKADAVPGALEFLHYANSRGVRVFYVTNRQQAEKEGTATNLKRLGFPEVSDETLLIRTDNASSSKEPRRRAIGATYHIVLLMGDDLNDFSDFFENNKTVEGRIAAVEQKKGQFGTHFIMLPNPMYGHWEEAIMGNTAKMSEEEKAAKRRAALKE